MMRGISVAFREETPNYDWVDEQTRKKILQKVWFLGNYSEILIDSSKVHANTKTVQWSFGTFNLDLNSL